MIIIRPVYPAFFYIHKKRFIFGDVKKNKDMKKQVLYFAQKMWTICPNMTVSEISKLVIIAKKLHQLNELICGYDSGDFTVYGYECQETGNMYKVILHNSTGSECKIKIRNSYMTIKDRLNELCKKYGIYFYVQTDPRGCPLYVSDKPLDASNYLDGIAVPL